jgi:hypothetical protein
MALQVFEAGELLGAGVNWGEAEAIGDVPCGMGVRVTFPQTIVSIFLEGSGIEYG